MISLAELRTKSRYVVQSYRSKADSFFLKIVFMFFVMRRSCISESKWEKEARKGRQTASEQLHACEKESQDWEESPLKRDAPELKSI